MCVIGWKLIRPLIVAGILALGLTGVARAARCWLMRHTRRGPQISCHAANSPGLIG
jgi:hypothetical protein